MNTIRLFLEWLDGRKNFPSFVPDRGSVPLADGVTCKTRLSICAKRKASAFDDHATSVATRPKFLSPSISDKNLGFILYNF